MAFAGDQKDQVQQATDIVQLIGEHVALKQKGREWIGLCPFHDDKNPSMHVSPQKQIFKCFVCGAGGDVFTWQMEYHQMSFREALESLAQRAGIELTNQGRRDPNAPTGPKRADARKQLHDANEKALAFYQASLNDPQLGRIARDYLERRGFHPDMIKAFQIGCAPEGWDHLARRIAQQRWDLPVFEQAGLISPRKQGQGHYDKLRHRLIFPICDAMGRPIAFGGRRLDEEDNPKYLNSPETLLFNKSRTLYGLHLAKRAIMDSHTAVIVEGYTDVIACHQAGACNVLATLGTAFTAEHVTELRRFADKVVLVFDGDEAGQKAADRAVDIFLHGQMDVSIAVLPGGKDPADLLGEEDGLVQWRDCIAGATSALDFLLNNFAQSIEQADTITGRQRETTAFITRLAELGLGKIDPVRRAMIVQQLATTLKLGESMLNDMLLKASQQIRPPRNSQPAKPAPPPPDTQPPTLPGNAPGVPAGILGTVPGGDDAIPHPATSSQPIPPELDEHDLPAAAPSSPDTVDWSNKLEATGQAERDVIGCLLQEPALFELTLDDGSTLDEAVTPGDMASAIGYRLYEQLYQRLARGEQPTLAIMARELAERNEHELVRALTDADVDVERRTMNDPKRRLDVLKGAARFFRQRRDEKEYRHSQVNLKQSDNPTMNDDQRLEHMQQMLRSRQPSATRIARGL